MSAEKKAARCIIYERSKRPNTSISEKEATQGVDNSAKNLDAILEKDAFISEDNEIRLEIPLPKVGFLTKAIYKVPNGIGITKTPLHTITCLKHIRAGKNLIIDDYLIPHRNCHITHLESPKIKNTNNRDD